MFGFIIFGSSIMSCFLLQPSPPCFFRNRTGYGIRINDDFCIFFCRHFIDEKIIIATGNMIDGRKSFVFQKQTFFIRQISPNSHIRNSGQRIRKILKRCMKCFKANEFIQYAFSFMIGAISQYDFSIFVICILHFFDPVFTGRNTVCICQEQYLHVSLPGCRWTKDIFSRRSIWLPASVQLRSVI